MKPVTHARKLRKLMLGATAILAGGTVLNNGCINTLASVPICGTVLTFCTPTDQLNLMFPLLETPDFNADPSCTIPLGCSPEGLYQDTPPGFPGNNGGGITDPENAQGGGLGQGGGGGGGGI
ncbi:hypothetical protein RAS2_33010 [Phycisphaerae bacterium RAS2]|nr:hypothetical protein RAS2_33010 [Phycisphaerae bacterium RAS2]